MLKSPLDISITSVYKMKQFILLSLSIFRQFFVILPKAAMTAVTKTLSTYLVEQIVHRINK